jgi:hypothetical protein
MGDDGAAFTPHFFCQGRRVQLAEIPAFEFDADGRVAR